MLSLALPLTYLIGFGKALLLDGYEMELPPAVEASIGYRASSTLGVGFHTRLSQAHSWTWDSSGSFVTMTDYNLRTLDLGVELELSGGRFALRPWLGAHLATGTAYTINTEMDLTKPDPPNTLEPLEPRPLLTFGLLASVDLVIHDQDRLCLFLEVQTSAHGPDAPFGADYHALTFGIAARR